jgi:homoserine dehydrogenase
VAELLHRNAEIISQRAGRPVQLVAVADLDQAKAKGLTGPDAQAFSDALEMLAAVKPDVLIELIGGYGYAKTLVLGAIKAGVHVVTANKALLAVHGNEIFPLAEARGVQVGFEASVAGGIPIIKALREGLAANEIESVAGIINGTTNFILSEMRDKGLGFDEVLAQAQNLGYAEADPTFDVEGVDAAHKITLLAAIAFGMPLAFDRAHVEGIRGLASIDIRHAEELGHRIKLLGITRRRPEGVELRVHPTLVPAKRLLANVEGAMNAVLVNGDAVGHTLYYGKGAGAAPLPWWPTSSTSPGAMAARAAWPSPIWAWLPSGVGRCLCCPSSRSPRATTCACGSLIGPGYWPTSRAFWPPRASPSTHLFSMSRRTAPARPTWC